MALSTGSPASRRSTKLVPLTTLPFVTSRQGMILFASMICGCCFLHSPCSDFAFFGVVFHGFEALFLFFPVGSVWKVSASC